MKILIKIGGTILDAAESRSRLTREIVELAHRRTEVGVVPGRGRRCRLTHATAETGAMTKSALRAIAHPG